jgi:hypothetical protein
MTKNQKTPMNSRRFVVPALTVCILAVCTGCHTVKSSYDPGLAPAPTLPCPVALSLSKEFTNYEHVTPQVPFVSDGYTAPFGPSLQKYATYVAQSVFGDVQVLNGGQPPRSEAKLLLVPRVTSSDLRPPGPGISVASGALGVHWDFNDPKTGHTLFSIRIQCESSHSKVNILDAGISYVVDGLMTNLTSMTIQRFNASKDIQRLSGH